MPLTAIINGKQRISTLFSEDEWKELQEQVKKQKVTAVLPYCHHECLLRTSHLGTQHFYHRRGSECGLYGKDKEEILLAKEKIITGLAAAGYIEEGLKGELIDNEQVCGYISTEIERDGWNADVLVTEKKNGKKFALQVIYSSKKTYITDYEEKQKCFKQDDDIKCAWLLRKLPLLSKDEDSFDLIDFKRDQAILRDDLPMFEVDWNEPKEPKVYGLPLEKFITELFLHHYRICNNVFLSPEQTIHIDILAYRCWSCGCPWDLYKLSSDSSYVIDIHGKEHDFNWHELYPAGIQFSNVVQQELQKLLQSPEGNELCLCSFVKVNQATSPFFSFKCNRCGRLIHGNALNQSLRTVCTIPVKISLPENYRSIPFRHRCYSPDKAFCPK